ncbi:hypothetical protein Acr_29g0001470 [Actinidia rufa]|uniref:Uncharacterized protein n=1 Tax=Actinidia rufa TaxID=165716 RepID=A0A7J0HDD2_9ERIC|nr:hypothetical protein Acr_29g0001470 [Actinidia rufa]
MLFREQPAIIGIEMYIVSCGGESATGIEPYITHHQSNTNFLEEESRWRVESPVGPVLEVSEWYITWWTTPSPSSSSGTRGGPGHKGPGTIQVRRTPEVTAMSRNLTHRPKRRANTRTISSVTLAPELGQDTAKTQELSEIGPLAFPNCRYLANSGNNRAKD